MRTVPSVFDILGPDFFGHVAVSARPPAVRLTQNHDMTQNHDSCHKMGRLRIDDHGLADGLGQPGRRRIAVPIQAELRVSFHNNA